MATVAKKRSKALEPLYQLLRVMEEVRDNPCKSFNWGTWGEKYSKEQKKEMKLRDAPNFCGTMACVAGWASLDPWFRRRGLKGKWGSTFSWSGEGGEPRSELFLNMDPGDLVDYFGITYEERDELFYGTGTVRKAIRIIKRLIKNKEREERYAEAAS